MLTDDIIFFRIGRCSYYNINLNSLLGHIYWNSINIDHQVSSRLLPLEGSKLCYDSWLNLCQVFRLIL